MVTWLSFSFWVLTGAAGWKRGFRMGWERLGVGGKWGCYSA